MLGGSDLPRSGLVTIHSGVEFEASSDNDVEPLADVSQSVASGTGAGAAFGFWQVSKKAVLQSFVSDLGGVEIRMPRPDAETIGVTNASSFESSHQL